MSQLSDQDDNSPVLKAEPSARWPRVVDSGDESESGAPPSKRRAPGLRDSDHEVDSDLEVVRDSEDDQNEVKPDGDALERELELEQGNLLHPGPERQRDAETQSVQSTARTLANRS